MKQPNHISVRNSQSQERVCGLRFLNLTTSCLLVAAGLVLAGCGEKKAKVVVTGENVKPVDTTAPEKEQQDQRTRIALAIRDRKMPPEPAMKLAGGEQATPEVLTAYNQLLLRAAVQRQEFPESLEELKRWRLPRLPTPPAGKRIVFDAQNCAIRLDPP